MKERNFGRKDTNAGQDERVYIDLKAVGASVTNVRQGKYSTTFTLKCKGFSLYNLRIVKRKDGGYFIAPPNHKGSNDKYYSDYALYLSDADTERLLDMVEAALNEEDEPF